MGVFSLYSITVYSECYIHMDERLTENGEGAMQKTRETVRGMWTGRGNGCGREQAGNRTGGGE